MRILLTAGPTREAIDPVRFLSNRSSGKMGFAIAEAAKERGHEVILISGPVNLDPPEGVETITLESAREMFEAVRDRIGDDVDAAIFCAAVADYRPKEVAEQKIKKSGESMTLELEKTDDILGSARSVFGFEGILVGFAAETNDLEANARGKLERKSCDLLVANDVSRTDIGFDRNQNEVRLFYADGREESLPMQEKSELGREIMSRVEGMSM
ncbi:MAG: bifunctional phosphopantothenoylcysteine decarboxylase/phosphopantothenate--cysteine ligase CoaBC [Verrucomicrobiales bacterium]|nr:bifunctional phosphopantothenoylcysteine decarboxylase/phosphopantothenate--cysteine ligase CoaBC [Verrucomicrobiales bacterium]